MDSLSWNKCPLHGEECKQYCQDCKVLFCHKCEEHEEHIISYMKRYLLKHANELPPNSLFPNTLTQVEQAVQQTNEQGAETRKHMNEAEETIKLLTLLIKKPEESIQNDLGIIENILGNLDKAHEQSRTYTLKDACRRAKKVVSVESEVREEVSKANEKMGEMKKVIKEGEGCIRKLSLELKQLEKAKNELEEELNEEGKFLLLMMRDKEVLDLEKAGSTYYNINSSIEKYRSCNNVEKVIDLRSVMNQKLVDVGQEIKMSEPINANYNLKTGDIKTANISHYGVIAINYFDNEKHYFQLTNIITKKQVEFEIEDYTATAFYDNRIIIMTDYEKIREAQIDDLFSIPSRFTLQIIEDAKLERCPPNTLTQQTRRVYYRDTSPDLFEFNVDTKKNNNIDNVHEIDTIVSSGGINMGVKCAFKDFNDTIYAFKMDNTVEYVSDGESQGENYSTNAFPSSSESTDLNKALYMMDNNFIYKNRKVDLKCPVKFNGYYSFIRLYQDVFLAYDENTKKWVLTRIIIP